MTDRRSPRPGLLPPVGSSPAAMSSGDGRGVEHLTPPQGVPVPVDADADLSTPIIVPLPTMSRTRTASEPPRMTEGEYRRYLTEERKRVERALDLLAAGYSQVATRVGEIQTNVGRLDERVKSVEADRGEFASLADFREWATTRVVDLSGKDGTNGKVGTLRARLDGIDKAGEQGATRRWSLIMLALGLIVTAGGVVAWAVGNVTDLRSEVVHLRRDVDRYDARPIQPQEPFP